MTNGDESHIEMDHIWSSVSLHTSREFSVWFSQMLLSSGSKLRGGISTTQTKNNVQEMKQENVIISVLALVDAGSVGVKE